MGGNINCATTALHRSESGVRQLRVGAGYVDYARELARYISCPSTVRVRTLEEFGKAPTLDRIRVMRAHHVEERNAFSRQAAALCEDERDADDFRVEAAVKIRKVPEAERAPAEIIPIDANTIPSSGPDIIAAIAREFGLGVADVMGPRRHRNIALARATCCFVLYARGNSYTLVGRWLGGRDHSTIAHSCRQFEALATPAMRAIAARMIGGAA